MKTLALTVHEIWTRLKFCRQTDGQTDGHTDGYADRQTDKNGNRQAKLQRDRKK